MRFFTSALIYFFIISNLTVPVCLAQRAGAHVLIKAIHGSVKSVNAQRSSFVLQTDEGDIEFTVTKRAKIFRGTEIVGFPGIEEEDEATVSYYEDETAQKQVLSITLEG